MEIPAIQARERSAARRAFERSQTQLCGTSSSGELLEYETLALRLCPPAVEICNISDPGAAACPPSQRLCAVQPLNKQTLNLLRRLQSGRCSQSPVPTGQARWSRCASLWVPRPTGNGPKAASPHAPAAPAAPQVVQALTELGLDVYRARISSDGGWFVDGAAAPPAPLPPAVAGVVPSGGPAPPCSHAVFEISEVDGTKVRDQAKLQHIKQLLNVHSREEEDAAPPLNAGPRPPPAPPRQAHPPFQAPDSAPPRAPPNRRDGRLRPRGDDRVRAGRPGQGGPAG